MNERMVSASVKGPNLLGWRITAERSEKEPEKSVSSLRAPIFGTDRNHDGVMRTGAVSLAGDVLIEEVVTAPRNPWQNPYVERIIGRSAAIAWIHVIVFNASHLKRILTNYFDYYHRCRTHVGLERDTPQGRDVTHPIEARSLKCQISLVFTITT